MTDVKQQIVYKPAERPLVKVQVNERWYDGELRLWLQHTDESWTAQVKWTDDEHMNRIDSFPADRVRKDDGQ